MSQLAKTETTQNRPTRWSAPSLDARLSELLGGYTTMSSARVVGPKTAADLQAFVEASEDYPMPARPDVEAMLGLLASIKRRRQGSDAEASAQIELYWHGLKDVALDDLRHAYDVLLKGSPWFPDVSEIRKAAAGGPVSRHLRNVVAAKMLIRKHREEWREPVQRATPEQVAQVKAMMGEGKGA